jgi:GxxExxY protein
MPHTDRRRIRDEDLDPSLTEVSRKVIGAAIEVHMTLGPGHDASVYESALLVELDDAGVPYEREHRVPVSYKGRSVGEIDIGLFVNKRFAVRVLAAPREVDGSDRTRMRAGLRAADLELGLVINFAQRRLKDGLVRVLNPDKLNLDDGGDDGGEDDA